MFASFRRVVDAPVEYTSAHLRCQLIFTVYNHKEFFYPLLIESTKGIYGFPRMDPDKYQRLYDEGLLTDAQVDDHNTPGPFSFLGYLRALQQPDFWGDELYLCLISMCLQIGITVINVEGFTRVSLDTGGTSKIPTWFCATARVVTTSQPVSMTFIAFRWVILHLEGCVCTWMGDRCVQMDSFLLQSLHLDGCMCAQMGAVALRWVCIAFGWMQLF